MPLPIQVSAEHLDLGPRVFVSTAVAASPSAATETTICTVTCTGDIAVTKGIWLEGCFSFTVGTSGVSARVRIRQTDTSGSTKYDSGLNTVTAGNLYTLGVNAWDASPTMPGQVYVLTLTIGSGAAASTVSAANLFATVV